MLRGATTAAMQNLKAYFAVEIPAVEEILHQETAGLAPIVRPVAQHVLQAGGKRLRPMLCILVARAAGSSANVYPLAAALELLHSATLLHDDILDNAALRRGRPAAHVTFGTTETILAGDVLLALANKLVASYGIPALMTSVSEAIMQTATGEIQEVARLGDQKITREEYFEIITGKTAYLLRSATECGAILAGGGEEMTRAAAQYGLNLGIAFQLVDDALDYSASSSVSGKPLGGDLREGKFTLPLLLYLESLKPGERDAFVQSIAAQDLTDDQISAILSAMKAQECAERTRAEAQKYLERSRAALEHLPQGLERDHLELVLEYVRTREK
ncbi:MAG: polyprenyl synthetase family protein [Desulfovibrionales bacterium]